MTTTNSLIERKRAKSGETGALYAANGCRHASFRARRAASVTKRGIALVRMMVSSPYRPRSRDENQAILDRLGLVGPFWRLA